MWVELSLISLMRMRRYSFSSMCGNISVMSCSFLASFAFFWNTSFLLANLFFSR